MEWLLCSTQPEWLKTNAFGRSLAFSEDLKFQSLSLNRLIVFEEVLGCLIITSNLLHYDITTKQTKMFP